MSFSKDHPFVALIFEWYRGKQLCALLGWKRTPRLPYFFRKSFIFQPRNGRGKCHFPCFFMPFSSFFFFPIVPQSYQLLISFPSPPFSVGQSKAVNYSNSFISFFFFILLSFRLFITFQWIVAIVAKNLFLVPWWVKSFYSLCFY